MEAAGVASQWQQQVIAGAAPSPMRSADSSVLRGRSLAHKAGMTFAPLKGSRHSRKDGLQIVAMAGKKKVNAYDAGWSKQWFGAGLFAENIEEEEVNLAKKLEKKKLLSQLEKAGLLSKAESVGLSLSTIEKLGLLSKAEDLGLLTLAENFALASPAALASLSIPLLVAGVATLVFVPDDPAALVLFQNILAALLFGGAGALFVGSIVLSGLQEE